MTLVFKAISTVGILLSLFPGAYAEDANRYPARPIHVIVPFEPGGNTDISSRLIGEQLTPTLGQPLVIESRPGAGSLVGMESAAKSRPDGYTIVMAGSSLVSFPALVKDLKFDVVKDFSPITPVNSTPWVITASLNTPATNLRDLIAYARANPMKLNVGHYGSAQRLGILRFAKLADIKLVEIPFKGAIAVTSAMLTGDIDLTFSIPSVVRAQVDAPKLRALAVTSAQREPLFPSVPTVAEAGASPFEFISWIGLLAPAGTPPEIVRKLNSSIVPILQSSQLKNRFSEYGVTPFWMSPAEFSSYIKAEVRKWTEAGAEAGIKPE